jgi:protein-S-isoprenylcysteine O-methyltransferase Ste14
MISDLIARQGNWLFRWRSYILLGFAPLIVLAISQPEPVETHLGEWADEIYETVCVVMAFAGFGVRVLTAGFVPGGTSGRNTRRQIADTLNTTGVYSLTRNPLYLGNALTIMGVVLFTQSLHLSLLMLFFLVIYLERIIAAEERFLAERFGETYLAWAKDVPAFFPKLSGWVRPSLPFSFRTVLRREHSTMLAILVSFFAIDHMRDYLTEGHPDFDIGPSLVLAAGTLVYVVLVWMKKRTRLLHVKGR